MLQWSTPTQQDLYKAKGKKLLRYIIHLQQTSFDMDSSNHEAR